MIGKELVIDGQKVRPYILLAHLNKCLVQNGQVKKGDKIAESDNTGKWTTGAHLHEGFMLEYFNNNLWIRDAGNGYDGALDHFELLEKPFMPTLIEKLDEEKKKKEEMANFLADFKKKNDNKLVLNKNTGAIGWYYADYLRILPTTTQERGLLMALYYMHRRDGGVTIDNPTWEKLNKLNF